ncbi:hypothetical protein Hamer_G002474, partial [Homarus americanus]
VVVFSSKKFQVQQHIQTAKHAMKKEVKTSAKQQALLPLTLSRPGPKHSQFNQDFSDIPLNKLNNKELVSFLEKYTDQKVPSKSLNHFSLIPWDYYGWMASSMIVYFCMH